MTATSKRKALATAIEESVRDAIWSSLVHQGTEGVDEAVTEILAAVDDYINDEAER